MNVGKKINLRLRPEHGYTSVGRRMILDVGGGDFSFKKQVPPVYRNGCLRRWKNKPGDTANKNDQCQHKRIAPHRPIFDPGNTGSLLPKLMCSTDRATSEQCHCWQRQKKIMLAKIKSRHCCQR